MSTCCNPYFARDKFGSLVPVPCGKCFSCREQYSNDWKFRLSIERKNCRTSVYLTLTYRDECLPVSFNDEVGEWQSFVTKREVQLYIKRVRKACPRFKFRYYAIGEYGADFNRAHYHICFFIHDTAGLSYEELYRLLFRCWGKGFIRLKVTEPRHIKYMAKYFNKLDDSPHITKPFRLMSKSIGLSYLSDMMVNYFFRTFATSVPSPYSKGYTKLPRYYRKKLDQMTPEVQPDNEGFVWSDIFKLRKYDRKGLNEYYNYFVEHFNEIYRDLYKHYVRLNRLNGYQMPYNLENPNVVFSLWSRQVPDIINARAVSRRMLDDAKVRHKYTKLNEEKILYG